MLGHRCEAISSPRKALEVVIRRNFDILITDVNLPGKSGIDLARGILARCPKMHVIFSSGHMILPKQAADFPWPKLPSRTLSINLKMHCGSCPDPMTKART
jgi:DNA-binding NtrC family response regulator